MVCGERNDGNHFWLGALAQELGKQIGNGSRKDRDGGEVGGAGELEI